MSYYSSVMVRLVALLAVVCLGCSSKKPANPSANEELHLTGKETTEALLDIMENEKYTIDTRINAAHIIAEKKDPAAVDRLIRQLQKKQTEVTRYAVAALAEIGDPRAIPAIEQLQSEDKHMRATRHVALEILRGNDPRKRGIND